MTNFAALLRALSEADVHFIIVGGVAGTLYGSARVTYDLDIVYQRTEANIKHLAGALQPSKPYLRGAPPGLPFLFDAETLRRGLNFMFTCELGDIDLFGDIAGGGNYTDLLPHTLVVSLFGIECRCLTLDRLIQVKRAAGRPKDLEAIAELEALAQESSDPQ